MPQAAEPLTALAQDTLNCMVLSEAVYKVVDFGDVGAADMLAAIVRSFPPSLLTVRRVQWAQPHAHHRRAGPLCLVSSLGLFGTGLLFRHTFFALCHRADTCSDESVSKCRQVRGGLLLVCVHSSCILLLPH